MDSSSDGELLVRPNSGRDVVTRSGEVCATVPVCSTPELLPESVFRASALRSPRVVLTSGSVEELETTDPASPLAFAAAGMAVDDVPPTILDALEMDLSPPVPSTVPASVGAVRRRTGRMASHSRRVVLVPQSLGTPRSVQDVTFDESGEAQTPFEGEVAPRVDDVENPGPEVFAMSGSDTESHGEAGSDAEGQEEVAPTEVRSPLNMEPRVRAPLRAFTSLDAVCLTDTFEQRARVMRSVPFVMRGAFRSALRIALQEIVHGAEAHCEVRTVRGWKLLLLLPRMLIYRGHRGGPIPRKQLETRLRQFENGDWHTLLSDSARCAEQSHTHSVRVRRRSQPDEVQRASRAMSLVQVGELSAARQALEARSWEFGHVAHFDRSRALSSSAQGGSQRQGQKGSPS